MRKFTDFVNCIGESEPGRGCRMMADDGRNFRLIRMIYILGFLDLFGVGMLLPFLPRMIKLLGFSHFLTGILGSLYGALQIFSSTVVGKISDFQGRKGVYVLSYAGPAIAYLFIGISSTALCLVTARVIAGLLKHGLSTGKAILTDIAPSKEVSKVLGCYQACSSAGFIAGPVIGGYLIDRDPTFALAAYACSSVFIFNSLLAFLFLPPRINDSLSNNKIKQENSVSILFSFKYFSTHGDFMFLRFLSTFSVLMLRTNFSIFVTEKFGVNNATLGYITSFSAIVGTLSLANVGYIADFYKNSNKLLKHALILLSASLMFISFAPTVIFVIVGLIPLSIATSNLRVCLTNLSLSRATEDDKGALIGLSYSVSSFSRTISPTLVGAMQEFDVTLPCYFSGFTAMIAVLMSLVFPFKEGVRVAKKQQ